MSDFKGANRAYHISSALNRSLHGHLGEKFSPGLLYKREFSSSTVLSKESVERFSLFSYYLYVACEEKSAIWIVL